MADETEDSELDFLMHLDPLNLSSRDYDRMLDIPVDKWGPGHIDAVIAYQRKARQNFEAGIKPEKDAGPKVTLDLVAMGLVKEAAPVKRRF